MPNRLQVKVCGRYKALFGLCVCLLMMLGTIIIMSLVGDASKSIQARAYDKKIRSLAAGMEERQLVRIMGSPDSKAFMNREDIAWLPEDPSTRNRQYIVYNYSLGSFFSHDLLRNKDIYLDGETKRIIGIRSRMEFWVFPVGAQKLLFLILLTEPVLCWLGIRWWCGRKLRLLS